MLKTLVPNQKRVRAMAQILKLKDTDRPIRDFFSTYRTATEECVIQGEDNQTVAAVLPAKQYEIYQDYRRRREQNFAVVDRIREKMKGFDPEEVQARIDQAVEEVKAESRAKRRPA